MKKDQVCRDHLGNEYPSVAAMLRAYGITEIMYRYRHVRKGWSLEKTLTTPAKDTTLGGASECEDHLGNKYPSKKDMCDHYRIPRKTFYGRLRSGWTLEKALTEPLKDTRVVTRVVKDHLGNEYRTVDAMCEAYGISKRDYITNVKNGLPLGKALTERTALPRHPRDHLGRKYPSFAKMLEAYGVSKHQLRSRLELGWTLKEILETPQILERGIRVTDPEGREFDSIRSMVKAHGITEYNFRHRLGAGFGLEDALSAKNLHIRPCRDHRGNEFSHLIDMLEYWSASAGSYHKAKQSGAPLAQCLLGTEARRLPLPDHIGIISVIGTCYLVSYKGRQLMMTDTALHAIVRRTRVDAWLRENGGRLPDGSEASKRSDGFYSIGGTPCDAILSADAVFRLIFFAGR